MTNIDEKILRALLGVDLLRQGLVVDERLVEPARLALLEDRRGQIQLRVARREARRAVPGHDDLGQLDVVGHRLAHHARELGRRRLLHLGDRHLGDPAEEPLDVGARLLRIEVARDHDRGVVGHVPAREERFDVVDRRRLQVLVRADDRVVVRVARRVHQLGQAQLDLAVGPVLARLPALVAHHVPLGVELGLRHLPAERGEAIRLQP
ncbi:MAG: hypothetical protein QM820_05225 [Minicystis sp.]